MVDQRRLLILSCSKRKRFSQALLPAIERYDGPAFLVLRRFLREGPHGSRLLDVYILSAAKGLIPSNCLIEFYDRKMSASRAVELQPKVLNEFARIIQNDYASLCLAMGRTYLTALKGWQDLVPANVKWTVAEGPMGKMQTQLKNWLWKEQPLQLD